MPESPKTRRMASPWGNLEFTSVERPAAVPGGDAPSNRGALRADGRPRASRAAQFMPFAALTGYYDLVREQERIVEPRHELTEEEGEELSRAIMQVRRGDLVRITYYDRGGYMTRAGIIRAIEPERRRLYLGDSMIPFDDIWKLWRP